MYESYLYCVNENQDLPKKHDPPTIPILFRTKLQKSFPLIIMNSGLLTDHGDVDANMGRPIRPTQSGPRPRSSSTLTSNVPSLG